jgi:hypothetical protein
MKKNSSFLISAFFLVIGLFGIIKSIGFHYWESITLPLITSSLVFILASIQLLWDLRHHTEQKEKNENTNISKSDKSNKDEIKRGMILFSWSIALVLAIYLIGFYIAIPVFCFIYLKRHSRNWITSLLVAGTFVLFIYLVFNTLLKTTLYRGVIFSIF